MNKTIALGAAAALSVLVLQPAIAQDLSVDTSVEASVSAEVSSPVAIDTNYGSLISSLRTDSTADFSVVTDSTVVHFVTVSSLSASEDAAALDNALTEKADALTTMRTDITANAALSAKLTAAGYTADDVIAVVANADSSLTVYIDDRA